MRVRQDGQTDRLPLVVRKTPEMSMLSCLDLPVHRSKLVANEPFEK